LALLRNGAFRRAWLIGVMTGTVRWSDMLITGIYVFDVTASAGDVALVTFLRFLPMSAGALSGALAARFSLGVMLRLGLGLLAASYALLAALGATGALAIWQVALGAFLSGLYWSTENSVRRTLLGESAGPGRTSAAIGMDWATISAVRLVGPVAGSALYAAYGVGACYAAFAGFYLIGTLLAIGLGAPAAAATTTARLFSTVIEDVRIACREPIIRGTLVATVGMNFFCFGYSSMVPVIGKEVLGVPPVLVGLLSTAEGVGALCGALAVANLTQPRWFGPGFLFGSFATLSGALSFSLSGIYGISLGALALAGIGSGVFATTQSTLILVNAPPERRSRTMGVLSSAIGVGQLGVLLLGPAASWLGAPLAVALFQLCGIAMVAASMIIWPQLWRAPRIR
jgi:MFS family permease